MRKASKFAAKRLDRLIAEVTADAYNESEQAGGFLTMIQDNLILPFTTQVLGQEVTVAKVDMTMRDEIVAICSRGKMTQSIPLLDLPLPNPPPTGAEWIDAYRRWCEGWSLHVRRVELIAIGCKREQVNLRKATVETTVKRTAKMEADPLVSMGWKRY
jgi:hypothetical protein